LCSDFAHYAFTVLVNPQTHKRLVAHAPWIAAEILFYHEAVKKMRAVECGSIPKAGFWAARGGSKMRSHQIKNQDSIRPPAILSFKKVSSKIRKNLQIVYNLEIFAIQ
jgi:hypothetical protein